MASSSTPVHFADRPEWADVTPIEQYEGINPLAPILYGKTYKDATDYLRAVVASGEKSPRVLELTEAVVRMNPSHYTAWQYRYETLLSLLPSTASKELLDRELELLDELALKHMKSYQVWHHRRLLLLLSVGKRDEKQQQGLSSTDVERVKRELEFISTSFEEDSKNYHTWSYRQWVLAHFFGDANSQTAGHTSDEDNETQDIWPTELAWTEHMLEKDIRNNSAWHHRFFVVFARPGAAGGSEDVVKREIRYSKQSIALAPNNASAWNYLRGVLDRSGVAYKGLERWVGMYTQVHKPPSDGEDAGDEDIIDADNPAPSRGADLPCAAAIEFLADIYEKDGGRDSVLKAVELWKSLANEHDTMRRRYWEHRIREGIEAIGEKKSA